MAMEKMIPVEVLEALYKLPVECMPDMIKVVCEYVKTGNDTFDSVIEVDLEGRDRLLCLDALWYLIKKILEVS